MNNKIINILKENKNIYISGEELSKKLSVSRSAIWKHINTIKDMGYKISSFPKKGYMLLDCPDILTYEEIKENLHTKYIGRNILHFETIESTSTFAKSIGDTCPPGSVVTSEVQTSGKGRLGRVWQSKGKDLCMSIVLKPNISLFQSAKITQVCAAAVYQALKSNDVDTKIKWPNDILMNDKKICGILTEMNSEINKVNYMVVGIGVNINNDIEDFPEEIQNTATSIKHETRRTFKRNFIAAEILNYFEIFYEEFIINDNFNKSLEICKNSSCVLGKNINLIKNNSVIQAKALDISNEGGLIVEYENNVIEEIVSGEISIRVV